MQLKVPHILEKIQVDKEQGEAIEKLQTILELKEINLWSQEKAVVALTLASRYLHKSGINKKTACEMLRQCMSLGSGGGDRIV